jgi:hypothetical protein
MNFDQSSLEQPKRDPYLPSNDFIREHTTVRGGEVLILDLTPEQAEAVLRYANGKGIEGEGPYGRMRIEETGDRNKVLIYLGRGIGCHKPLFDSLGIREEKGQKGFWSSFWK